MAKKENSDATYSPAAVFRTLKKVEWPSFKQLMASSWSVIMFTVLFGLYFFVCELASSALIKWIVSI